MLKALGKILLVFVFLLNFHNAKASLSLITDAQTQQLLEEIANPLIKAAGLEPDNIKIYIVNDSSINAFVTMGQNIFVNTGLITKFNTPDSLIGVFAHEIGHIASGHIARSSEEYDRAKNTALISYILGITAIIAGSPEAGQGLLIGGGDIAQKSMLKYSRIQEEAADRNALLYLNRIKYPSNGLVKLLESFEVERRGMKGQINEYLLSHPISSKRVSYLVNNSNSKFSNKKFNSKLQPKMTMVLAKLEGFTQDPQEVILKYKNDSSKYAKYALSVAYYRNSDINKSLEVIDYLISKEKDNGFFHELKAQILYESGRVKDAIISYQDAVNTLPGKYSVDSRIRIAQSILHITKNDQGLIDFAIKNLLISRDYEVNNPQIYRQLHMAYGKQGNKFLSYYNYANYKYLTRDLAAALKYAKKADEIKGDKISLGDKLKLEDLIQTIKTDKESKK